MLKKTFDRIFYGTRKIRKSRLHDEKDNFVGWGKVVRHAPHAFATGLLRITVGYRPVAPWIAYDAVTYLKSFLNKETRVLEFGSGMSTVWYAKAAGEVCSVDDYRPWYTNVEKMLSKRSLTNVNYCFAETPEQYFNFMAGDPDGFDFIMVDGTNRANCMATAVKLLKPGGILYLDNSDKHSSGEGGDIRLAEECAIAFAKEQSAEITYFTDFAPATFFVQQGLMVKRPK